VPDKDLELCLVAPAYNEQECIEKVVNGWLAELALRIPSGRYLAIIVNDGSKDRTGELLDRLAARQPKLLVIHQANSGHGAALLRGYREALDRNAEWIFHVDSDDQFEPSDLRLLWQRRSETRFLTGYRQSRYDALHRLVITRLVRALNLLMFGYYLKDANIPFRLIHGPYLSKLLTLLPRPVFAPNIFLSLLAARDGQQLMEVPVTHKPRETGRVSIVRWKLIKVCLRSSWELFQFRRQLAGHLVALKAERAFLGRSS
jgi:glycosyltransferase involved in cell wall biosynthesis